MLTHSRSKRKPSGGRYIKARDKRLYERASQPILTKLADRKLQQVRGRGGHVKSRLLTANTANVFDQKSKKFIKAKIITIKDNPANRNYVRRNIITKGTVLETDAGLARVTSRPGQEGAVNAVLISQA